jgi:tetratricopeptide (TPR) repeat protein
MVVLFMAACSRKKNTFLSRTKQSVTSEFNILYNGNIAFKTGKEQLARTYRDNFWETLPIERIEIEESNTLIEESITSNVESVNENFNIAEEKAVKAIQMHSIYIEGKEYNPQIDEAYILLGKARYFDGRFVQALDAFNFILKTYPTSNNINQAKVWRAKTQIRLNNEEIAIENLLKMKKNKEISKKDLADASAILAQAYINLDSIEAAMPYIRYASENVKDDELKGRYTYILGQLYDQLEKTDSANLEFDKVIALNRKSPRVYMINAYIEKARNFDFTNEDRVAFLALLFDL